jgi:alpha-N-acetylglucosamine transferase
MSNGALIFAHNNSSVDYTRLAVFAATRVKQFLNIPVSIVTDNRKWLDENFYQHPFDKIIEVETEPSSLKVFYDGTMASKKLEWKNLSRNRAYDLTPYDRTLVIDSDYILSSSILRSAFEVDADFQIYQKSFDLAGWRDTSSFQRINSYSIPFYWATAFVFEKNNATRSFFDLITYIKSNWDYFKILYGIDSPTYRNDFVFSIAIHIMNGKTNGEFATPLPGTMTYIQDRDILIEMTNTKFKFLVEKKDHLGQYLALKTDGIDVHIMNKVSLLRVLEENTNV